MERGSDKHSSRLDEEMKEEVQSIERGAPVQSHVEEFRQVEPIDVEEPEPGVVSDTLDAASQPPEDGS